MKTIVFYKNERYQVEGDRRTGFNVFKIVNKSLWNLGRSIADSEKMAVIDVLRNQATKYY